jgi:hypothetical protein
MPSSAPDDQVEEQGREQEAGQPDAEAHREIHHHVAQHVPEPGPDPGPREGADRSVAEEARDPHPGRAGQAGGHRIQLGQEAGGDLEPPRVSEEAILGPPDERLGPGREPAEQRQHACPAPPAQAVPAEIRAEGGHDGDGEDLDDAQPAARGQRSRREQPGNDRHRYATLIGQHPAEQHPLDVVEDHRHVCHPPCRS